MRSESFVDYVRIHVKAGDGGDGVVAFRREKYVPEGGPAGGHGGDGGGIYLEGEQELVTLLDLKLRPFIKAVRGETGGNWNRAGASADNVIVKVPLGTTVTDAETGEEIGQVTQQGQRLLVARGGHGGRGNESFATSTHRTPRKCERGEPGDERNLILELKMIADVGLVGLPNAGKSTLLAHLTNAHPKIANYPFTTIHPNLGVMPTPDLSRTITLADIPGLIEGAHTGAGLGDRFLRHIERTKVIVHLVAPQEGTTEVSDDVDFSLLAEELVEIHRLVRSELDQYSESLNLKPSIVCLNKIDLLPPAAVERIQEEFARRGIDILPISAEKDQHLETLRARLFDLVDEVRRREQEDADAARLQAAGPPLADDEAEDPLTEPTPTDPTP